MTSFQERFYSKVAEPNQVGCHLWLGKPANHGYGNIWCKGRLLSAHRVAWEIANGPIKDDLCVLHKCDVPMCVNPDHLFLGTRADNSKDMIEKNRGPIKYGKCKRGHDYRGDNIIHNKSGKNTCRECYNFMKRKWYHANDGIDPVYLERKRLEVRKRRADRKVAQECSA